MNSSENRLDRLLEAAQKASPPVPQPSPWFEQRMIAALQTETKPFSTYLDAIPIFRIVACAAVIAIVSIILPVIQPKNPYAETIDLANSTVRLEQLR
jgi:hypothetical protein